MRRTTLISALVALGCFAALAVVSSAPAGDFADAACSGDPTKVCPAGTVGQPYSVEFTLKEPGDACPTFRVSSGEFPPGLSFASDEGVARGTPTQAGSFTFYVTVSYTCGVGGKGPGVFSDQQFTININPGAPPKPTLVVTTASLPDGNINQPYTSPGLAATGSAVNSWSLAGGALPAGLTLGSNGVITGTPTQSGTFTVTVQANGNGVNATKQLSLFVLAPLAVQTLVNKTPPETGLTAKKLVGAPLTTGVKAVGGRPPYTFTATGTLPPGLTLDPATGKISGAGTAAGRYPFTVTVTDGTGAKASVEWNVTILPLLDFTKGKGLPVGRVDRLYSARIPVRGKDSATAEFALAGQIPPGLGIDENGRLTGVLVKPGSYQLKVYAFSANGAPISKVFRVRVRG
jgi:large repetitive protein